MNDLVLTTEEIETQTIHIDPVDAKLGPINSLAAVGTNEDGEVYIHVRQSIPHINEAFVVVDSTEDIERLRDLCDLIARKRREQGI